MRRIWGISAATLAAIVAATSVQAQRAAENAVNSAEDAFGVSIGNEAVGLYSSTSARGFNPQLAGNIRLNGLYFDQQSYAQGRVYADTTMHVGLSAQSYPFPAPTGIADTRLRQPNNRVSGSASFTYGAYDGTQLDGELSVPVVAGKLDAFAAVSIVNTALDWAAKYPRWDMGLVLRWTPNDNVEVITFGQNQIGHGPVQPLIFTAGGLLPPEYNRRIPLSQEWADRHRKVNHAGFVVSATVFGDWLFRAGLFRSYNNLAEDYAVFFRNIQANGAGTLDVLKSAHNYDLSYSGEARLSRTFTEGDRQHTFHLAVRGRDAHHLFGGGSTVSFGAAQVGVDAPLPEPTFPAPASPNFSHVTQVTPGASYVGRWRDVGEVSVGVQKSFFKTEVTPAGLPATRTTSEPWLYNGTLAIYLGQNAALYGSYTKGLEESGVAPENAANRAEVLPVSLTEQVDAGLRYKPTFPK